MMRIIIYTPHGRITITILKSGFTLLTVYPRWSAMVY